MSDTPPAESSRTGGEPQRAVAAVLLVCFRGEHAAAKARRSFEGVLRSRGDPVLDTTVLQVNEKHQASVYDPRRLGAGVLVPMFTWGAFGFLTGGVPSMIASGLLGAVLGGFYAYRGIHHTSKLQLAHLGASLPARSSAVLTFAEASDPGTLLAAASSTANASASSAAVISDDLSATVAPPDLETAEANASLHVPRLRMIMARYAEPHAAAQVATQIAAAHKEDKGVDVELVVETEQSGRRHVTDPRFGSAALGRNNVFSWGGLGLVCGAIAGITGGNGVFGLFVGGLLTGVAWGLFGLAAGALFGYFVGRAVSANTLKGIGSLFPGGTSTLLAWTEAPLDAETKAILDAPPGMKRLVLGFKPTDQGALLNLPRSA